MASADQAPELVQSQQTFVSLLAEVAKKETHLASGQKLGPAAASLRSLDETKLTLGNPRDRLIRLTPALFNDIGLPLSPIQRAQMESDFAFYFIALPVNILPAEGARFRQLRCELDFRPKGSNEVIVQTLIPASAWEPIVNLGVDVDLSLDADLNVQVGVDVPSTVGGWAIPVELEAHVKSKNEVKGVVALKNLSLVHGAYSIVAGGAGNSFCHWQLKTPDQLRKQDTHFALVFKAPPSLTTIELTALAAVEPNLGWLRGRLGSVMAALPEGLRQLLVKDDDERTAAEKLPKGDAERWQIDLPQS